MSHGGFVDVFTHFFVPYAVAFLLKRPREERLAAGLGGYAPDLDVLTSWLPSLVPALYFLGHRGLSHSVVGAPLFALVAIVLVTRPVLARRWPRMAAWKLTPRTALVAAVASFTHLALDGLTTWGVPLLYPFSLERFSLNLFSYSILPLILVSGYCVVQLARGRLTDRGVRVGAIAVVLIFLLAGGVRIATMPDMPEEVLVQPGNREWVWATFEPTPEGWVATTWSLKSPGNRVVYADDVPPDPEAAKALEAARASVHYRGFKLYAYGPEVVRIEAKESEGFDVTFLDVPTRYAVESREWRFADSEWGRLRVHVDAHGVVRTR